MRGRTVVTSRPSVDSSHVSVSLLEGTSISRSLGLAVSVCQAIYP